MKNSINNFKYCLLTIAGILLIIIAGCKSYFVVSDFEARTANHRTVAILPFEMIFTGIKPEKLTDEDIKIIEEAESKAFMISLNNEILQSTKGGRKPLRIDIQHFDKTLSILNSNNIDIRASWKDDPAKLARILEVDAVLKARIEKRRLMSDLESYGIDLGLRIINILSDYNIWFWLPANMTKSKEIKSSYSLIDRDGIVLWSIAHNIDADWRQPTNNIIDNINRKSARHFPYRTKK